MASFRKTRHRPRTLFETNRRKPRESQRACPAGHPYNRSVMQYRTLGRTGLKVSEIGYGAWGIGGIQWKGGEDDQSIAALRRSVELGLNFIDTALAYGEGHSERLVGK